MADWSYELPIRETQWHVPSGGDVTFNWDYETSRERLLRLYEKGKDKQWNATHRIDWDIDVDPTDPEARPSETIAIYGSDIWNRMTEAEQATVRHHQLAWLNSQFLHGEQGALICAAKVVGTVPHLDAKFYAATQVIDEARHVEVYSRYLREKLEMAYPINESLKTLLDQVIADSRWDMTYLGMQIMIEGLALAAFGLIRDYTTEPLAKAINTFVMQDEARHVAFGNLALRDFYPNLTEAEREEREEFVVEASYLMRDRFTGNEVWERLGLPVDETAAIVEQSPVMASFRTMLFSRLVPNVKAIGLWGPKVQKAFADMGVLVFQDLDPDTLAEQDEALARQIDDQMRLSKDEADELATKGVDERRAAEVQSVIRLADDD